MSTKTLPELLADPHEIVLRRAVPGDPLLAAWRIAAEDASDAYAAWSLHGGARAYAVYLAAADQEDAAARTLREDRAALVAALPHWPLPLAA